MEVLIDKAYHADYGVGQVLVTQNGKQVAPWLWMHLPVESRPRRSGAAERDAESALRRRRRRGAVGGGRAVRG